MVYTIYEGALECEMPQKEFWNSSLSEVEAYIERYQRREQRRRKEAIQDIFTQASLIGIHMQRVVDPKSVKVPAIWDLYPDLFKEEKALFEKQESINELETYKERRRAYAAQHNQMRRTSTDE